MNGVNPNLVRRMERIALAAGFLSASAGAVALVGWALGIDALKGLLPGLATMKINTALCILMCGAALILKARSAHASGRDRVAEALAGLAALIALLSLCEYIVGVNLRIDLLLGPDPGTIASRHPGRMSAATAACLFSGGLAIALLDRATRAAQALAIVTIIFSSLALVGYLYGVRALYQVGPYSSMALHTAAAICLTATGTLMARPRRCVHHLLVSDSTGGELARRLLPFIVAAPLLIGWMRLEGQKAGWYAWEFGVALFAVSTILILAAMVWWNASALDRGDKSRRRAEADRDELLSREHSARQRAETAVHARDQLLAVVSHELRTPLTPALLLLSSLENQVQLAPEIMEDIRTISDQVRIEARLVEDLLDMVGLGQGKVSLDRRAIDARELIAKAVALFGPAAADRDIALDFQWAAEGREWAVDQRRLQQVLRNLLDNALKFTPLHGRVTVRATQDAGGSLAIEVIDTGIGFDSDAASRIFSAFEQADASATRKFGGLGIGLTISKMLVELHGGTIVASSPGIDRGATFRVILPHWAPTPASARGASAGGIRAAPGRLRILLVEDNEQTLRIMRRLLSAQGYEVHPANTGAAALAATAANSFDLLISDIGLPDLGGWDLLKQIRAKTPLRGIALSGFASDEDRRKSLDAGFTAHLSKPVEWPALLEAIQGAAPKADAELAG